MSFTMVLGFSIIAGLLAGFLSARLGPRWAFPALLAAGVAIGIGFWIWLQFPVVIDPFMVVVILGGIIGPFVICVAVSGLIGMLVRRIVTRSEAP